MIEFEEAYRIVMQSVFVTDSETIAFDNSCGRILDEDILSDVDMPPFNRSAVDGYACHNSDLNNDLDVIEIIAAGNKPLKKVGRNQCSKIMTGAMVPFDCDIVFMVEESEKLQNDRIRFIGKEPKLNISKRGEDVKIGDIVLEKPTYIQPQDIAVMASVGHTHVVVKKRPVVGILSTGNELVNPSEIPGISQIRNSNAYQLVAQVTRAGGDPVDYGIASDNETVTLEIVERAIRDSDLIIITGGVSMGDFDFVPSVLEHAGVKILFDRVKVQPGKPTTFGIHSKAIVFGLPGNPVSSFVQFELLIRPAISRMMGYDWKPFDYMLPMAVNFERRSFDRLGIIPIFINKEMEVVPVDFHGSAHLTALSGSHGLVALEPGKKTLMKGEIVNVRQI